MPVPGTLEACVRQRICAPAWATAGVAARSTTRRACQMVRQRSARPSSWLCMQGPRLAACSRVTWRGAGVGRVFALRRSADGHLAGTMLDVCQRHAQLVSVWWWTVVKHTVLMHRLIYVA